MANPELKTSKERAEFVRRMLGKHFKDVEAYDYNPVSIRVRIVDPSFKDQSLKAREESVQKILDQDLDDIQADITLLLLLAPGEEGNSLMNYEFNHPGRASS